MKEEDLKVGMKVRIIGANSSSWVTNMDRFIGQVCTISDVCHTSHGYMFHVEEDPQNWYFGPEDADPFCIMIPCTYDELCSILGL